jgi:hypothetical protein
VPVASRRDPPKDDSPLFCARCAAELEPGTGSFYQVRIEAVADPTPPNLSDEDLPEDISAEIQRLVAEMESLSPQEAMDQVCRRMTIFLCTPCYQRWIEDPAG